MNRVEDVFVRDRTLQTTRRVSVSSTGQQGNGSSSEGLAISTAPLRFSVPALARALGGGPGAR
jgi:hypothetical protein